MTAPVNLLTTQLPVLKRWRLELADTIHVWYSDGTPMGMAERRGIQEIVKSMPVEEQKALNMAYVACLRLHQPLPEAASYNFIGPAVRWKIEKELHDEMKNPEFNTRDFDDIPF